MFVFDELILKNKNLSKLYYLYEELSTNKGLSKELANELINQSITLYENLVNKISSENINEIKLWVGSQNTKNRYADLDNLFSKNVTDMINKVVSKNQIAESLMKNTEKPKPIIKASLNEMVDVANKTVKTYISSLNESEQKELNKILSKSDKDLKVRFEIIKEDVLEKLDTLLETESDDVTKIKLNETIEKVKSVSYNKLDYYKLNQLKLNL
jgi:F0F1-type ATP synthase membrane subunit b/b'